MYFDLNFLFSASDRLGNTRNGLIKLALCIIPRSSMPSKGLDILVHCASIFFEKIMGLNAMAVGYTVVAFNQIAHKKIEKKTPDQHP